MRSIFFVAILLCIYTNVIGSTIHFNTKDAVIWLPQQTVSGYIDKAISVKLLVHANDQSFFIHTNANGKFSFNIILHDSLNNIWVEDAGKNNIDRSGILHFTLGYKPLPVVKPVATIKGEHVALHVILIDNPYNKLLSYYWQQSDANNTCIIQDAGKQNTTVAIPQQHGVYNFSLRIVAGNDTCWFSTYIIRDISGLHAFDMHIAHAQWIDNAIIYQVTPDAFVANGKLNDITTKLAELKLLGINTILLQPVFTTEEGHQGYDIIDFFSVRKDIGTTADLSKLVQTAHDMQMKVMLDMVPNHTSIHHPYAKDCAAFKKQSHYYSFYQHEKDNKLYAQHYNTDSNGFVYYFWKDLVNLNYNNPEVEQWMIQVCLYWIKKFDIDGYRFDAVWGVNARDPSFAKQLQVVLKSVKPSCFLLAEDKGNDPTVYNLGFDAAYDWTNDLEWVSQWSWQTTFNTKTNPTVFNDTGLVKNKRQLEQTLFNRPPGLLVRFIENNDMPRFIKTHGIERTRMAAALMFSMSGIPLIYNGQETGNMRHPYTAGSIYASDKTIRSFDRDSLFGYYQKLIALRKQYPVLRTASAVKILQCADTAIIAVYKESGKEQCVILLNTSDDSSIACINSDLFKGQKKRFTDLLTNEAFEFDENKDMHVPMKQYSIRWLIKQPDILNTNATITNK